MGADVFILPEVACPKMVNLPEGYQMEWMGNNDWKGLGVIWKTKLKVNVPEWYNPKLEFMLPLMVDKNLLWLHGLQGQIVMLRGIIRR